MPVCAFADCGDPTCHLCSLARSSPKLGKGAPEDLRRGAVAVPKARPEVSPNMPKKKHRVGPHR